MPGRATCPFCPIGGSRRVIQRIAVLAATIATGCCTVERSPSRTANQVKQALEQADLTRAQGLLVDDLGQPATIADVRLTMSRTDGGAVEAISFAAAHSGRDRVTARFGLANGSNVVLVKRGAEYRVRFAPMPQDCPVTVLDALVAFRAAVAGQSALASLGPLTNRLRTQIDSETSAVLDGLRYVEELEVSEAASTAQVTLPSGHVVVLRTQDGCWRIDEVN